MKNIPFKARLLMLATFIIFLCLFLYEVYDIKCIRTTLYTISKDATPQQTLHLTKLEDDIIENLSHLYITQNSEFLFQRRHNKTCAQFPPFTSLKFANNYWQVQATKHGKFHIYNAYLDDRKIATNATFVRILGLYDINPTHADFHCQFWYNNVDISPIITKILSISLIWQPTWPGFKHGTLNPYLITCMLPEINGTATEKIPASVSLVEDACDNATNNLNIITPHRSFHNTKQNFAVCVKGLFIPEEMNYDKTLRLVEWIELIKLLGGNRINFYVLNVNANIKSVLDYYKSIGFIDVTSLTIAGDVSNSLYYQNRFLNNQLIERYLQEVIPYNDCFYKNQGDFKYIALLDIDEVIVPKSGTWIDLLEFMQRPINRYYSSFVARNVYFFDHIYNNETNKEIFLEIPKFMHMSQHVYRAKSYTPPLDFVKGFHDSDKILTLHNHLAITCHFVCNVHEFNLSLAHLQHYRSDCAIGVQSCNEMKKASVLDERIWNFKDNLVKNVLETLENLGFLDEIKEIFK